VDEFALEGSGDDRNLSRNAVDEQLGIELTRTQ
jgi:hypothetical protein